MTVEGVGEYADFVFSAYFLVVFDGIFAGAAVSAQEYQRQDDCDGYSGGS